MNKHTNFKLQGALLEAARIENRIKQIKMAGDDSLMEELELLMGECTPKWDVEKKEAIFNGRVNGITTSYFRKMLKEMDGPFTLRINSEGGEGVEGIAIFNMLRDFDYEITGISIGDAYSAASLIFMGCDKRLVATGATVGIHKGWCLCMGNSSDMLNAAADLEKLDSLARDIYATGAKKDKMAEIDEMIEADTHLNGEEAVKLGLADGVYEPKEKKGLTPKKKKKMAKETPTAEEIAQAVVNAPLSEASKPERCLASFADFGFQAQSQKSPSA